ncbi:chitosanase [Amycolatopsis sp. NBC_01488]|uniref:chitosanase n=1 Tax=Amycolatopsis sp. NBC_01488 TaxID=2903563 RepID=UPI002E2DFB7D|nr:chitosanase [Amycolatopsis sp. NBC_01488]
MGPASTGAGSGFRTEEKRHEQLFPHGEIRAGGSKNSGYPDAWRQAAGDQVFRDVQESERDRSYFDPAVSLAKQDGLRALGQFACYDAAVVHGYNGLQSIRSRALGRATPPAQGGDEAAYLNAFLDERVIEMKKEAAQRVWLQQGNFDLATRLRRHVYGQAFEIA